MSHPVLNRVTSIVILLILSHPLCSQTQGQMNDGANAKYLEADKNLNGVYQDILKSYKSDTAFIRRLKTSQTLWIKFRDAELKMKYPDGGSFGSVKPMCASMYLESLTNDRIKTLKQWMEGIEEGDVCAGSIKTKTTTEGNNKNYCNVISPATNLEVISLSKKLSNPTSSESFLNDFLALKNLQSKLNKELRKLNPDSLTPAVDSCLKKLGLAIPFLKQTYTEEGTVIYFTLHNQNLLTKAALTKEKNDDELFALLKEVYGDYGEYMIAFPVWMTKASHLSGYSNLGDGIHTKLLKKITSLKAQQDSVVKDGITSIYDLLIDNLTSPHSFGNTRETVLKELRALIADRSIDIKEADIKKLIETEKKIQTEKFQFECKTKKCSFE